MKRELNGPEIVAQLEKRIADNRKNDTGWFDHEEAISVCTDAIRAFYYRHVRAVAEDFRDQVKDGEIKSAEKLDDLLWERCDGDRFVIITWLAQVTLLCSEHWDAFEDCMEKPENPSQMAFFAFREDIAETLEYREAVGMLENNTEEEEEGAE